VGGASRARLRSVIRFAGQVFDPLCTPIVHSRSGIPPAVMRKAMLSVAWATRDVSGPQRLSEVLTKDEGWHGDKIRWRSKRVSLRHVEVSL